MSSPHTARTPGRNEPCPCGSGKKYKNCHGSIGSPAQRVASGQRSGQDIDRRFAQAFQLFQQGAFAQCTDICAAIVDGQPEHVLANHLAGLCRYQMQDFAGARRWLERAAELAPGDVDVRINLAKTLAQLGAFREGEVHARRAVDLKPDLAPALAVLATTLIGRDELSEASRIMERAVALGPDNPEVIAVYGDLLRTKERMAEARQAYERCLAIDPNQVQILNNLGLVLKELGELAGARVHLERARALSPNDVEVINNLGELARIGGEWDVAESLFLRALEIDDHWAETYIHLGSLFHAQGNSIRSWRWLERGVKACPEDAGLRLGLAAAYVGRQMFPLAERQIEEAIRIGGESSATALAQAGLYNHRHNPEAAADAYARAVDLDPHNPEVLLEFAGFEEHRNHFADCAQLAARARALDPSREPEARIWAARAAREQRDYGAAERELASLDFASLRWEVQVNAWFELGKLRDACGDYVNAFDAFEKGAAQFRAATPQFDLEGNIASWRKKGSMIQQRVKLPRFAGVTGNASTPIFIVGFMRSGTTLLEQILTSHPLVAAGDELLALSNVWLDIVEDFGDTYPQFLADLGEKDAQAQVAKWRGQYLDEVRTAGVNMERGGYFTDKFPLNLLNLPLITMTFPEAPIIHIRRNPMDCVFSNFVTNLGSPSPWAYDLEVAASYYRGVLELAEGYREHLPMRYHEIRYEHLVADPEPVIREVAEFMDLPWDDAMLRHHENKRTARTPSHAQVNQPMYTRSVERYRNYEQFLVKPLEILEPLMHRYGYLET